MENLEQVSANPYWLSFLKDFIYPALIACLVTGTIGYFVNKKLDEFKHRNAKELQLESFFREISGDKISDLLDSWTMMITDPDAYSIKSPEEIKDLMKDLLVYGSAESVRRASCYQQYNYGLIKGNKSKNDYDPVKTATMFYSIAYVVVQMKKDFTGYEIDPDDLVKLKVTDYEKWKDSFEEGKNLAKKIMQFPDKG